MTLEPHYSPEPAQIRDSSQPYTENIRVQHIWVCKELPNQKGHGVIEMNKKSSSTPASVLPLSKCILFHIIPSILSTAGCFRDHIKNIIERAELPLPSMCTQHFTWDPENTSAAEPGSWQPWGMNEGGGSDLPSHLSLLSLQPLFLQERQQHFMGDWNNCGKRPRDV